jgi:hypothetical protein
VNAKSSLGRATTTAVGTKALSITAMAVAIAPLALWTACVKSPSSTGAGSSLPLITQRFEDNFDRPALGDSWNATNNRWTIRDGVLRVSEGYNHPLWLKRRLPRDARIEFDAWSDGQEGDIKCEVYGDGRSFAREASYTATSYVLIFGGWNNRFNVIARMDEHAADRRVRNEPHVEPGRHYHWTIVRRGNRLEWSIDGQPMLEMDDSAPLYGPGHEFFAFNNWRVGLNFDNLVITPL